MKITIKKFARKATRTKTLTVSDVKLKRWIDMTAAERTRFVTCRNTMEKLPEHIQEELVLDGGGDAQLNTWIEENIPFGRMDLVKLRGRTFLAIWPDGFGGCPRAIADYMKVMAPVIMPTTMICAWI